MTLTRRTLLVCMLLVMCQAAGSATTWQLPHSVLQQVKRFSIPHGAISVEVREMQSEQIALSLNSKKSRNPASVIKLLITLAALETLGPNYQWQTRYLVDGKLADGTIEGNLVMRGGGDPFLTVGHFWHQVNALKQRGIHTINGDLILDGSFFHLPPHDPAEFDDRPSRLYNVGADANLVNFSATRFVIQPFAGQIQVFADPPLSGLKIVNKLSPATGKCRSKNDGWRYNIKRQDDDLIANFSGSYRARCGQHSIARVITDNNDYTYRLFRYLWEQNGGQLHGGYQSSVTPDTAERILTYPSEPLADIITGINKYSNNVMSRQVFLTLAKKTEQEKQEQEKSEQEESEQKESPADISGARRILTEWLMANDIPGSDLVVDNGSGLSRQTRITGETLTALLHHAWNSNYRPEFLSSLSLSALDGTMRKRLRDSDLQGRARIKTGLINGVRSMAGYVHARNQKYYSVVMMIESDKITFSSGNEIQDALLKWIYQL